MIRTSSIVAFVMALFASLSTAHAAVSETPFALTKPVAPNSDQYADAAANGTGFVVTWTRVNTTGTGNSVHIQSFNSSGKAAKPAITIARGAATLVGASRILKVGADRYLVIWRDMSQLYGGFYSPKSNKFSGKKSLVATNETWTDLSLLSNGNIALLTAAYKSQSTEHFVHLTILSKTLGIVRKPTPIHSTANGGFNTVGTDYAVTAVKSGGIVTWYNRVDSQVYVRAFNNSGTFKTTAAKLNTTANEAGSLADRGARMTRVVKLTDGRAFATWVSLEGNPYIDGFEVRGRFISAAGAPTGAEFRIAAAATGKQTLPVLLALPGNKVLCSWADETNFKQKTVFRTISATGALGTLRTLDTNDDGKIGPLGDLSLLGDGSVLNALTASGAVMAEGIAKSKL